MKRRYREVQAPLALVGESTIFAPPSTQVGGLHYKEMPIQPVEFNEKNLLPYCMANVIKYLSRHKMKHGREDLEKAAHYCELGMSMYEETKHAWVENTTDWAISPQWFCKENRFDAASTKVVLLLCSVFHRGGKAYLEAKAAIEQIIASDYPPVKAATERPLYRDGKTGAFRRKRIKPEAGHQ